MSSLQRNLQVGSDHSFSLGRTDLISPYEIETVLNHCCSSLAPCGFLYGGDTCTMVLSTAGFLTFSDVFCGDAQPLGGHYNSCLSLMTAIVRAVIHAADYMIPPWHISLCPEDILLAQNTSGQIVPKLLLRSGSDFNDAFCQLCHAVYELQPKTHADKLESAIKDRCSAGASDPEEILITLLEFCNRSMYRTHRFGEKKS